VRLRGLDEADVRRRMEVQAARADRIAAADAVIDNSGDLEETHAAVQALWAWLVDPGTSDPDRTVGG
jgi:dephospho-CoA kinase